MQDSKTGWPDRQAGPAPEQCDAAAKSPQCPRVAEKGRPVQGGKETQHGESKRPVLYNNLS